MTTTLTSRVSLDATLRSPLRVLLVASAYPRTPTDTITPWLVQSIRHLECAGVHTEVLAPAYRGLGEQKVDGVHVHRFRYAPRAWERLTHEPTAPDRIRDQPAFLALVPSYLAAGALAAARLAQSGRFDLVHALWPLPHGVLGLAAKRAGAIPLVCTFFGAELHSLGSGPTPMRRLLRSIVERSDGVTAISTAASAHLSALVPGARVTTIPFGAAIEGRHPTAISAARRMHDVFTVLFVGRLLERRGLRVLLNAISALARKPTLSAGFVLDIVGGGSQRVALETRAKELGISDIVRFHGVVSADALTTFLAGCDALVLPAVADSDEDTEESTVVLLEALSHGKPVIASATGGFSDIVRQGETGLLVPPGNAGALARAIERLAADPHWAHALAAAGRRLVHREFSWPSIVDRLVAVYAEAVRRHEERRS